MRPDRLPHDPTAEMAVLGAVLLKPAVLDEAAGVVGPGDFHVAAHGEVFRAMLGLRQAGRPVDLVSLNGALKSAGLLDRVGGPAFLATLDAAVATSAHVLEHARVVRDHSLRRALIRQALAAADAGHDTSRPVGEVLAEAGSGILDLGVSAHRRAGAAPAREWVSRTMGAVERRAERPGVMSGLATGFADLDSRTGGLQPGDLIYLGARPSQGKTALALNIALNVASRGRGVLFCSLEMSEASVGERLLAAAGRLSSSRLRWGRVLDWTRVVETCQRLSGLPLWLNDQAGQTVASIGATARGLMRQGDLGLVVVDYLGLLRPERVYVNSRVREVTEASHGLKALAKDLRLPVLALVQLNRAAVENARNPEPQLAHLRESGDLEQDADMVWFLWSWPKEDGEGVKRLSVAKHRNGPTGLVKLRWLPDLTLFENLESHEPPAEAPSGRDRAAGGEAA